MSIIRTATPLDQQLLDQAVKILGASSRSEAIDIALRQLLGKPPSPTPSKGKIESPTTTA